MNKPKKQNTNSITISNLLSVYFKGIKIISIIILLLFILFYFISKENKIQTIIHLKNFANIQLLTYFVVGFIAQLIDGAMGMAYGISSTTFLMSTGVSPAVASASVHIAEIATTGVSGYSHWKMGNVNKKLFWQLAIPGVIGAAVGAYFLSSFDGKIIKPFISAYLMIMGIIIIFKAFKKQTKFRKVQRVKALALFGGFVDSSGGGGWGPVVTTTFLGAGATPKLTIGTVNASEFIITLTSSSVFTLLMGANNWQVICGLIIGGVIAAPIGAFVCNKINVKYSMVFVGALIIFISLLTILKSIL